METGSYTISILSSSRLPGDLVYFLPILQRRLS